MMSTEGIGPKADIRKVAWILQCISEPNVRKKDGFKNPENFCRCHLIMVHYVVCSSTNLKKSFAGCQK